MARAAMARETLPRGAVNRPDPGHPAQISLGLK